MTLVSVCVNVQDSHFTDSCNNNSYHLLYTLICTCIYFRGRCLTLDTLVTRHCAHAHQRPSLEGDMTLPLACAALYDILLKSLKFGHINRNLICIYKFIFLCRKLYPQRQSAVNALFRQLAAPFPFDCNPRAAAVGTFCFIANRGFLVISVAVCSLLPSSIPELKFHAFNAYINK